MQMILQWKWEWTECEAAVSYWHLGNPLDTKWAESKHAVLTIYSQTNSMDLCFCRYQETLLFAEHHLLQFVCLPQSVSHHLQQWVLALLSSGAASLPQPVPQHTDFFFPLSLSPVSNAKNIDPGKFPMHYCYCVNNVTNDLTGGYTRGWQLHVLKLNYFLWSWRLNSAHFILIISTTTLRPTAITHKWLL